MLWCCIVWYGTVLYSVVWYGVVWYDMMWWGMVWCSMDELLDSAGSYDGHGRGCCTRFWPGDQGETLRRKTDAQSQSLTIFGIAWVRGYNRLEIGVYAPIWLVWVSSGDGQEELSQELVRRWSLSNPNSIHSNPFQWVAAITVSCWHSPLDCSHQSTRNKKCSTVFTR